MEYVLDLGGITSPPSETDIWMVICLMDFTVVESHGKIHSLDCPLKSSSMDILLEVVGLLPDDFQLTSV